MKPEIIVALLSFFVSIGALTVSIRAYKSDEKIYQENRKLSVKPVLVFLRRSSHKWEKNHKWTLKNVGNGPALNILLGELTFKEHERVERIKKRRHPIPVQESPKLLRSSCYNWRPFTDCYPI